VICGAADEFVTIVLKGCVAATFRHISRKWSDIIVALAAGVSVCACSASAPVCVCSRACVRMCVCVFMCVKARACFASVYVC
jgi:hypothetical protein